jgi:hypothetical protein
VTYNARTRKSSIVLNDGEDNVGVANFWSRHARRECNALHAIGET